MDSKNSSLRWVRKKNGVIAGVAGGIASALNLDPWLVRILFVVGACIGGIGIFFYVLCLLAFPREDRAEAGREKMLLGVCSRIDSRGEIEVGLARLIALLLLLGSFGMATIGYLILHFVLSDPTRADQKQSPRV